MNRFISKDEMKAIGFLTGFAVITGLFMGIQVFLLSLFTSIIGVKLATGINLKVHKGFDWKSILTALMIAMVSALIITGSDKLIFAPFINTGTEAYRFSYDYFLVSILYGGIVEEIMLRLFMMSLLVWIGSKIFRISKEDLQDKQLIFIAAIFVAALIFALGHYPVTVQLFGKSMPIMIRMFMLNGLAGLGFGYLYWKKGLSYAIMAHMMTHVFSQVILLPILY